ncbi:MAG: phytoene desaturase family protein [Actinomycetes bacterium]
MANQRDVIVIGSGHNALIGACYLARAGLDVEVVETDRVLGGAVSTVERWPGYAVDRGSSAHIMVRHTGIVEDLRLDECGLTYLDMDPWAFAPFGPPDEQQAITFHVDLERTHDSIAAVCGPRDAAAYLRFVADWGARNEAVFAAFQDVPTAARLGRHLWGAGKATDVGGLEMSRQFLQPGDQLLDEVFEDERLKTALSWLGAQSGPPTHEVATADLVGWNALMHTRPPGRAVGGSGALTAALAERLRRTGGTVRLGDGAAAITHDSRGVTGVLTESAEHLQCRAVLAGCHVLTTLELLGDEQLLRRARTAVRVGNGIGMAVRLGTTDLPRYPSVSGETSYSPHSAMQLIAPSRNHLRAAHGEFGAGRPPTEPPVLLMSFSAMDASIAPAGRHNITAWAQWHPYRLANGEHWKDIGEREADRIVAQVDKVAPGFSGTIEHRHVQTPLDLEEELGLRRGNVMHVEMGLDEMFAYRPLPELAGYRTPVDGLYLTGASTHPGGGVFGASGRTAARVMIAGRRRWR